MVLGCFKSVMYQKSLQENKSMHLNFFVVDFFYLCNFSLGVHCCKEDPSLPIQEIQKSDCHMLNCLDAAPCAFKEHTILVRTLQSACW
jgi:hypothetical protein